MLDEGHVIRRAGTKLAAAVKGLRAAHRLILSGTPVQARGERFCCCWYRRVEGEGGVAAAQRRRLYSLSGYAAQPPPPPSPHTNARISAEQPAPHTHKRTPIFLFPQNNLLELWSLFDFLMPAYLGSQRAFSAQYGRAVRAASDAKARRRGLGKDVIFTICCLFVFLPSRTVD